MAKEDNIPGSSKSPLVGKTITIDAFDLLEPEDSEQGHAVMLARKLYDTDDYAQGDLINMSTGIGVSADYHALLEMTVGDERDNLGMRYFAAIMFLAGRLSIALAAQR